MNMNKCEVTNCERKKRSAHYCAMHYSRVARGNPVGPATPVNIRHGLEKHPLYHTWEAMRQRCNDPKAANYHNYGGRGIKVCARWNDFRNFVEDMGDKPPRHSIDRIDVNGDYTPENCRWATYSQQRSNQRKNV